MLDLTAVKENYYDIKLLDGTVLHLKRPSQFMVQYLIQIDRVKEKTNEKELLEMFGSLFERILNRNSEGKKYDSRELIQDYDFHTIGYVIKDYFEHWSNEVADEVDFLPSLQEA